MSSDLQNNKGQNVVGRFAFGKSGICVRSGIIIEQLKAVVSEGKFGQHRIDAASLFHPTMLDERQARGLPQVTT
jgi:hypothetical protein